MIVGKPLFLYKTKVFIAIFMINILDILLSLNSSLLEHFTNKVFSSLYLFSFDTDYYITLRLSEHRKHVWQRLELLIRSAIWKTPCDVYLHYSRANLQQMLTIAEYFQISSVAFAAKNAWCAVAEFLHIRISWEKDRERKRKEREKNKERWR